jgi:hypothetical protein
MKWPFQAKVTVFHGSHLTSMMVSFNTEELAVSSIAYYI